MNRFLRAFIYIVVFLSTTVDLLSQNKTNKTSPRKHKIFTETDGFEIKIVDSMLFDNDGWLWISGNSPTPDEFKIASNEPVIQRFNGSSFHSIPLPNFHKNNYTNTFLHKRSDGQLYVIFSKNASFKIYLLNPTTLEYQELKIPEFNNSLNHFEFNLFPFQDGFIVFLNTNRKSFIYKLGNDSNFTLLSEVTSISNIHVTDFMEFDDHFVVSDERIGVITFDLKGNLTNTLNTNQIEIDKSLVDYKLKTSSLFKYEGDYYANFFAGSNDYYKYNPKNRRWIKSAIFGSKTQSHDRELISSFIENDSKGNIVEMYKKQNSYGYQIERYLNDLDNSDFFYSINIDKKPSFTSQNFEKEIFLASDGQLHHIIFENPNFSIFLKEYSIRSIVSLRPDEYLVSTESEGLFVVNVKTKEVDLYETKLNGKPYLLGGIRGFFKTATGFWSNYDKGIIHINDKEREFETFIHYPVSTMVENDDKIYYGTYKYRLMEFDKESKRHIPIANTDSLDIQAIIKKGSTIYGATGSGMLIHREGKTKILKPEIKKDQFLLSLNYHKDYGLLLGSSSGKLFQYDSIHQSFKTLYQDPLKASIATFLFDDKDRIWLNTFLGIVTFNPQNNTTVRYGENDGMSHYESNRYSAVKTEDGHFLVGTLKGLNYFHPDSIRKSQINADLKFSSVTYFDKDLKKRLRELSPNTLNNLESINLPAEHRNIELEFGLLGEFISEKVNYRYRFDQGNWNNLGAKNNINFVNLSPGSYLLEIEALNLSRDRIGNSLTLELIASDYFYNSVWFYVILLFLLATFGFWYVSQLKKQHVLKEQFATKLINTQERERSRIARELHDSIGQKLLVLKNSLLLNGKKKTNEMVMVEETINEVRDMSHNMHPFQFNQIGLTASLRNLIDAFQRTSEVFFSSEIEDVDVFVSKEKEIFIFRMLQECISNVEKHAEATACNLQVIANEKYVCFILKDNGKGFNYDESFDSSKSLGLKTLAERVQYVNANLEINSKVGKGTTVTITILKQ